MNTTVLYAELLVVGSGAAISILIFFYSFFGDKSWFSNIQELSTIGGLVSLIPVLSIIYLLGIVISNVGYILFQPLLVLFKSEVTKDSEVNKEKDQKEGAKLYKEKRFQLYNSAPSALIEDFEFRQSKIRICRGWVINASSIAVAFWICLRRGNIDERMARFFIITAVVLMVLTSISWAVTMKTQLDLLRDYRDSNMPN